MKTHKGIFFLFCIFISGCSTQWYKTLGVGYEVQELGPKQYAIVASGPGLKSQKEVEEAFDIKAKTLMGDTPYSTDYSVESYRYFSGGYHQGYRVRGIVKAK